MADPDLELGENGFAQPTFHPSFISPFFTPSKRGGGGGGQAPPLDPPLQANYALLNNPMYVRNCHTPLQTGLKITNQQHTRQSLFFNSQSPYVYRIKRPRLLIPHLIYFEQK